MKTPVTICLFSFLFSSLLYAQQTEFLPLGNCFQQVHHTYYSLCYDNDHRQASWVKHHLTIDFVNGKQKRTNNYRSDLSLNDPVGSKDYRGSGFDRGHLLPAADMKFNQQSMSETFFMSNMSPQVPSFNRGIWAAIERHTRDLVRLHGEAHVVTAPVLVAGLAKINSDVSIPNWYYKIIYFPGLFKMKAFLIENKRYSNAHYDDFQVTVDEIESLTGFDFFAELPDSLEDQLEAHLFTQ